MGAYLHTTFAQAKTRLASLLGDSNKVFWSDAELGVYIIEALRFWGVAAQYWKASGKVNLTPGKAFYDMRTDVLDFSNVPLQSTTIVDRDLINEIAFQLIEPPISNWAAGWIGTEMFSLEEITDILSKSRDDILRQSGILAVERAYNPFTGVARIDLNDVTVHVLRCSIQEAGSTGQPLPMWAISYWQAQNYLDTAGVYPNGRPKSFMITYTPILALDLFPSPNQPSTLRVYSIEAGPVLNPTVAPTIMTLPEDACWVAKYRTMADLLAGDGLARAPQMAQYCEQRALDGLDMLGIYQSLLWAELDGKRMTISSLAQLDAERPRWQSTTGRPRSLHQLNWNLFTVFPVPDNNYTIEVELVRKAIVPSVDGDFIQVGREQLQAIYDYAQHIATFKLQGAEFEGVMPLYQQTIAAAMEHQAAQAGSDSQFRLQLQLAESDRMMRPYRRRELVAQAQETAKER